MYLFNEGHQSSVFVLHASVEEYLKQFASIHRVVGFLEIDEHILLSLFAAMYLTQQPAHISCRRLPIFEACLIVLGLEQVP